MTFRITWPRLPHRRQRFWRYVSPRRRGVSLTLLVVLLGLLYGYWYFTNDQKVRHEAERYLESYFGWRVRVGRASFSIFGTIELENVRVFVPGDSESGPLFRADKVLMRHRTLDMAMGHIKPLEITCDRPVVTVTYDASVGLGDANRYIKKGDSSVSWKPPADLPPVHLRGGLLRMVPKVNGKAEPAIERPINITMSPTGQGVYEVLFEQPTTGQEPAITGTIQIDLATGQTRNVSGTIPQIQDISASLPSPYSQWLKRYNLRGTRANFRQVGTPEPGHLGKYEVEMIDLSLKLPPEEGGLELTDVRGKLLFDVSGVSFQEVSGHVEQAGRAEFVISGRYDGYEPDSPFDLTFEVRHSQVPPVEQAAGRISELMRNIMAGYKPSGKFSLWLRASRQAEGGVKVSGWAQPEGMSITYHGFPYTVEDVRGKITFDETAYTIEQVTARRGDARFGVSGRMELSGQVYDIRTQGQGVVLDSPIRQAVPGNFKGYWDLLSPTGKLDAAVRVFRGKEDKHERLAMTLTLSGGTSMEYKYLPYRVESLQGQVKVEDGSVTIDLPQGRRGDMSCSLRGTITNLDTPDVQTQLDITARCLSLDKTLVSALGPGPGQLLAELNMSGTAQRVLATVHQGGGKPSQYSIQATLADTTFTVPAVPYAIAGAQGEIVIEPGVVSIRNLAGKHGQTKVQISGTVRPGEKAHGLDLQVQATGLKLDQELLDVLPAAAQRLWRQVQPEGQIDCSMKLRQNLPEQKAGQTDYTIVLEGQDLSLCYVDFPYAMRNVSGKATIRPDRMEIEDMHCKQGAMESSLSGTVWLGDRTELADLAIKAVGVPIDAKLVTALPKVAKPMLRCISQTGKCDLDIKRLRLAALPPMASTRAAQILEPLTTQPGKGVPAASEPAPTVQWNAQGAVTFHDAVMDVGFGNKTVNGTISGSAGMDAVGLSISAQASLQSLEAGGAKATDLTASLRKSAVSSTLHIEDMAAKLMGGRLAGSAEILLSTPMECGLQMEVNDLKLEELYRLADKDPKKENLKVEGLLAGNIRLKTKVGNAQAQQAVGELWISRAKITQMPVMLGLQNVVLVSTPGDQAYTEGILRYELKGNTLLFNEIYLSSQGMSVVGSGKVDMKTEALRMTFLAKPGGTIPRIDSLSDLLESLTRELSEIRITGTISKPIPRTVPLGSVDNAMRRLLNPSKDD